MIFCLGSSYDKTFIRIKKRAITLCHKGYSLKEISEKLSIAKSTASNWLCDIYLSKSALKRLKKTKTSRNNKFNKK